MFATWHGLASWVQNRHLSQRGNFVSRLQIWGLENDAKRRREREMLVRCHRSLTDYVSILLCRA